jgi:uncharacterized protein
MKTRRKRRVRSTGAVTAFWDTSGIVPLCSLQSQSAPARQHARVYSRQVVWWATPVEALSAFHRLSREGQLTREGLRQALARLEYLRGRWSEIQPSEEARHNAERLLATHKLRAADAFQLAAALVWCGNRTRGRVFIGAESSLADAAETEGFTVIRLF